MTLILRWDAIMLGLPGRYVGAGVRWPWDVRHPLPHVDIARRRVEAEVYQPNMFG